MFAPRSQSSSIHVLHVCLPNSTCLFGQDFHRRFATLSRMRKSNDSEHSDIVVSIEEKLGKPSGTDLLEPDTPCLNTDKDYVGPAIPKMPYLNASAPDADEVRSSRLQIASSQPGMSAMASIRAVLLPLT